MSVNKALSKQLTIKCGKPKRQVPNKDESGMTAMFHAKACIMKRAVI